ncbi:MAG TPA: hypothetical protein VER03_04220 [Bryobacteraceae bacterium]|nr:hypothetical protein [Bryobacteraceae bacterium]
MWKQYVAISATFLKMTAAAADKSWVLHGGAENGQRFSRLHPIDERNVAKLGLVWSKEIGASRGLEATPVVDKGAGKCRRGGIRVRRPGGNPASIASPDPYQCQRGATAVPVRPTIT